MQLSKTLKNTNQRTRKKYEFKNVIYTNRQNGKENQIPTVWHEA